MSTIQNCTVRNSTAEMISVLLHSEGFPPLEIFQGAGHCLKKKVVI